MGAAVNNGCGGTYPNTKPSGVGACVRHDERFCADAYGNYWPTAITVPAKEQP